MRTGYCGQVKLIQAITVTGAITTVGKRIALAHQINPTNMSHSDKLLPRLQEILAGFRKEDYATNKTSPVEVDVPEYFSEMGRCEAASELLKSNGDNILMAYNYLLQVGEYRVKKRKKKSTQTEKFKL